MRGITSACEPPPGDVSRSWTTRISSSSSTIGPQECSSIKPLPRRSITRRRAFEVNDLCALTDLVAHGLGVAIVPHAVAADDGRLRCIALRPSAPLWEVVVATAGDEPSSMAARALLGMVLASQQLPRPGRRVAGSRRSRAIAVAGSQFALRQFEALLRRICRRETSYRNRRSHILSGVTWPVNATLQSGRWPNRKP